MKESDNEEGNLCRACGSGHLADRDCARAGGECYEHVPANPVRGEQQLTATPPAALGGRRSMEAAMIGTFLVSVAALVIAVLGCAWVKPVASRDDLGAADADNWQRRAK